MVTNYNLSGASDHFFSPDIVVKISDIIGLSKEKTLLALKSVVPNFIGEIISKGSTPEGATSLIDLVNQKHFEADAVPDEKNLNEGTAILDNIYGSNFDPTVNRLTKITKLDQKNLIKLMGIVAPVCLGIIGERIKRDHLNQSGFMSFIKEQKKELAGYSQATSDYYSLTGNETEMAYENRRKDKTIWTSWILAFVLAAGFMIWWSAVQYRSPSTIKSQVTTFTAAPIAILRDFFENPNTSELPKTFYFDEVYFLGESTRLAGGFNEISYVAGVLKDYPNAKVKLVGLGENVGTDKQTNEFANRRAELVRNELVARGASPDQITTMGLANASPAGFKTTTPGNAQYQKMQLIVIQVK